MANRDIGYGLRPEHVLEQRATCARRRRLAALDFAAYAKMVSEYTVERASELSGVPQERLIALARLYADPGSKVMSLWTMGFNQHVRGVWANHLAYNLHLLTGKIAEPGNSPFSLTGQPSACGTAREVGTFAHRLPADMLVTNPEHRKHAEEIWKLPAGSFRGDRLPRGRAGSHAEGRQAQRLLDHVQQQPPDGAQHEQRNLSRLPQSANFIVCSDAYPTVTSLAADVVLPAAMWVEKEGAFGNAERRTQCGASSSRRRARRAPTSGSSWNSRAASRPTRCGRPRRWRRDPNTGADLFDVLFRNGAVDRFPLAGITDDYGNHESKAFGFHVQKGLFEEYAEFGRGHGHDLAPYDVYHEVRGLRWPVVNGGETRWRYREGYDPYVEKGSGMQFYGNAEQGPSSWRRPTSRRPRCPNPSSTCGSSPAACSSTGIPVR